MPLIGAVGDILDPRYWVESGIGGGTGTVVRTGLDVNPATAMKLSAFFAGVRAIAEDTSRLPFGIVSTEIVERNGIRREIHEDHPEDPAWRLLNVQANSEMSAQGFRETLTQWALSWGNGLAEIEYDNRGRKTNLWPIHPTRVELKREKGGPLDGQLTYHVHGQDFGDGTRVLTTRDVFHLKGLGDGLWGYSIPRVGAQSLGLALAVQTYEESFFANAALPTGIVETPQAFTENAAKNFRESMRDKWQGLAAVADPMVLEDGATFKPLSISPQDAMLIDSRHTSIEDIARWLRIPPHKLQHLLRATFSNIEHQSIEYLIDALLPWVTRWEAEVRLKLIAPGQRRKGRVEVEEYLRGDMASQSQFFRDMFGIAVFSPNDIRQVLKRNPTEDGDLYFVNSAMVPLKRLAADPEGLRNLPPNGSPPAGPSRGAEGRPPRDDGPDARGVAANLFEDAARRVLQKESGALRRTVGLSNRGEFVRRVDNFYGKHAKLMLEIFGPPAAVVSRLARTPEPDLLESVEKHVKESRSRVVEAFDRGELIEVVGGWETGASELAERFLEAALGIGNGNGVAA